MSFSILETYKKLDFGNYEAILDKQFKYTYVEPPDFETLLNKKYTIIVGRKGSGKSALVKGIKLKHLQNYEGIVEISANHIDFRKLVDCCHLLSEKAVGYEIRRAIRNMWYSSIINTLMNDIVEKNKDNESNSFKEEFRVMDNYLRKSGMMKKNIHDMLVDSLDSIIKLVISFVAKIDPSKQPSSIIDILRGYGVPEREFKTACSALETVVLASKGYVVTFDNIDRYFENSIGANVSDLKMLRYIFEGLIYAIYDIAGESIFDKLLVKALIPTDKYLPLNLRDLDKIEQLVREINWDKIGLQWFICRRIAQSLEIKIDNCETPQALEFTWYKIFPRFVSNGYLTEVKEPSFDYVLRHTLYRPRDLQIHCTEIVNEAIRLSREIDEKLIQVCVTRTNQQKLSSYILQEFETEHPYLADLLNAFKNKPNVLTYDDVYKFARRGLDIYTKRGGKVEDLDALLRSGREKIEPTTFHVDAAIKFLYDLGFLGYYEETPLPDLRKIEIKKFYGKTYGFYFCYNNSFPSFLDPNCKHIVIHPIFYEKYQIVPKEKIVVG